MAYGDSFAGSVVYVVSRGDGWHKIGVTADIQLRLYHIHRDIGFKPVTLVHTVAADRAAAKVENLAHWALIDFEHDHEWFRASAEQAIQAVENAMARYEAGDRMQAKFCVQKRLAVCDAINARIPAVLRPRETRHRLIEAAVLAELARRERTA
ncbi:GIY-YIG nuclease family protein [Sphingomonas sp. 10B4]|uniref:GIY-YIG nuclease family protein n=1 Tax=Sphingomonas sp. 10B4 TaxID=3048575 RepID=UPI002AB3594A|nr:GIY-YIG nuclease family protein [Sphingomonas sp. 10B4]MDY7525459.1 GIY-YIG nuclease family protein [Sphingomonas sp. 10B4]MEB0281403.1 GIY-YIG nuclease family protein [Sphingomonas sp. 10B4]